MASSRDSDGSSAGVEGYDFEGPSPLGGSGGVLPQKILTSGSSEM